MTARKKRDHRRGTGRKRPVDHLKPTGQEFLRGAGNIIWEKRYHLQPLVSSASPNPPPPSPPK
ncbi:hypothetical protein FRUB_10339 [Fimbriiglobus ruber]|uniref:Uncharacterized protein n=1 Tax=Fimbriiglobus ruber TaxID=1908690 RepID=A0A225D742_9BACT|nr:hypothetical protein FRUB_10339 [Fimbriiglobus ruber]